MTILSLIQDCARELKQPPPAAVVASTDKDVLFLLAMLIRAGRDLRSKYRWPVLTREWLFATDGTGSAALPGDFDYELFNTHWDRTNHWELRGPLSPEMWQQRISGIVTSLPKVGFRIKGVTDKRIFYEPAVATGSTLVFEYQTTNWVRPKTWTSSTTYTLGDYIFYNGNYYYCSYGVGSAVGAGNGGTTPPTHTTGSQSFGGSTGVTWDYFSGVYDKPLKDTDIPLFDEHLLTLEVKWRWKREQGVEWQSYLDEAVNTAKRLYTSGKSAPMIDLTARRRNYLIGWRNVPDGNYGA